MANNWNLLIDQIVERRIDLGITQKELAKCCGLSQPGISRLERKDMPPKLVTLYRILDALHCTMQIVPLPDAPKEAQHDG